jgi:hypothetical protein
VRRFDSPPTTRGNSRSCAGLLTRLRLRISTRRPHRSFPAGAWRARPPAHLTSALEAREEIPAPGPPGTRKELRPASVPSPVLKQRRQMRSVPHRRPSPSVSAR